MIKRITSETDFSKSINDIHCLYKDEDVEFGHRCGLLHNPESIINNFGIKTLLNWDVFVWANEDHGQYDSICIFINEKNVKFGVTVFSEFLWLSKNPKVGYKLFKTAIEFARKKDFKYISVSSVETSPSAKKVEKLYDKLGFLKDQTTFIAKL